MKNGLSNAFEFVSKRPGRGWITLVGL